MSSAPDIRLIRAVAFDLDDTLLRDDLSISEKTLRILRGLCSAGWQIIPASGRAKLSMKPFVDRLECASLYIACNGAEIWDGKTHELLHAETFSAELGREIASFGNRHRCYSQTYAGDCFYFSEHSVWADRYASASMLRGVYVGDLSKFIREPRNKILMMAEESKIASMLVEARSLFSGRASVTCSKPWFLEFNPLRATKGIALRFAAERLDLKPENVIAFGDGLNDLPMLEAAGWSVAMANGQDALKTVCDDICASNQEDGVADYLATRFGEVIA